MLSYLQKTIEVKTRGYSTAWNHARCTGVLEAIRNGNVIALPTSFGSLATTMLTYS